jgi:predicted transcriptional regulator
MFGQQYGLTMKQIAEASQVPYPTFLQVLIGKTPGFNIVPKVDAFMEDYAAKTDPTVNMVMRPFPGTNLPTGSQS